MICHSDDAFVAKRNIVMKQSLTVNMIFLYDKKERLPILYLCK